MIEPHHIKEAAVLLGQGGLVAFPTETVYGLGGDALSDRAVARIYETKGRPSFNPLIVHVPSLEEAKKHAVFNATAEKLARHFWPGALTLVLPRRGDCKLSLLLSAGLDTVAMRVPSHPVAQALLKEAGIPIAAPSANQSGCVSPTEAAHVRADFGDAVYVLDGGDCPIGIESTVVDVSADTPVILRPGSVTPEHLEKILPPLAGGDRGGNSPTRNPASKLARISSSPAGGGGKKSPGMLERHYAPSKPLRLNASDVRLGEALLAFGAALPGAAIVENLSPGGDVREAAANLFRMLRLLDAGSAPSIAVMPIPEDGLGVAINDRLCRAAKRE